MSELNFQGRTKDAPLIFRALYGRVIDNMSLLLSGKDENGEAVDIQRTPITPKKLLHERISCENEQDRDLLRNNYVFTALPVMDNPDGSGEVKLVHYSQSAAKELVDSLNSESTLENGALVITPDQYHAITSQDSHVIAPNVANELRNDAYSNVTARRDAWEFFAEGDTNLVDKTLELVHEEVGGTFDDRMGLWLSDYKSGLRLLVVGSVGDYYSNANGNGILDYDVGRLVGVGDGVASAGGADARKNRVSSHGVADAVGAVHNYLDGLTGTQRPTKKGLREALSPLYSKK